MTTPFFVGLSRLRLEGPQSATYGCGNFLAGAPLQARAFVNLIRVNPLVLPGFASQRASPILPRLGSIFLSITVYSLREFQVWRTGTVEPPSSDGVSTVGCLPVRRVLPAAPFAFDSVLLFSHPRHFHTSLLNSRDRSLLSLPELEISCLLVSRWCVAVRARGYRCFAEQLIESLSNRSLAALGHFELGETSQFDLLEEFSNIHIDDSGTISGRFSRAICHEHGLGSARWDEGQTVYACNIVW